MDVCAFKIKLIFFFSFYASYLYPYFLFNHINIYMYVFLNYASAFIAFIFFSLVLNFMGGFLNLTVLLKFIVCMLCLLFVHAYSYVGLKISLELVL